MHLHLQILLLSFTALFCIISASPPGTMTFTLDAKFGGVPTPHEFKHVIIEQGGEGHGDSLKCRPQLIGRNPVKFSVDWKTCMQKVEKAADLNDVKIVIVFRTYEGNKELEEMVTEVKFKNYRSNDLLEKLLAGGEATIVMHNQADPVLKYKATVATREAGSSSSSTSHRGNRMEYHHHLARLSSSFPSHHRGNGVDGTYRYLAPLTPNTPTLEFSISHKFHPYIFVMASIDVGEEIGKCRAFAQRYNVKIHLKFCNGEEHMEKLADFAGKTGEELDAFMSKLGNFMSGYGASIDFHYDGNDLEKPLVHCHKVEYIV